MRKRLFEIIDSSTEDDKLGNFYDVFMMIVIVVSLVPLAFKNSNIVFEIIDKVAVVIFIIDYLLRLITADYKLKKKGFSFVIYPVTPMAIIDLLCILPSINLISSGFRILKVFRLFRTLRVFRVFKAIRYSKSINMIIEVFKTQKKP
ncbi:MAG: ion transporter, partial [Lachnospiraceae bacterium]|nr:ion transporter [Lachnospiraceae bacterium]